MPRKSEQHARRETQIDALANVSETQTISRWLSNPNGASVKIAKARSIRPPNPGELDDVTREQVELAAIAACDAKRGSGLSPNPRREAARALGDHRKKARRRREAGMTVVTDTDALDLAADADNSPLAWLEAQESASERDPDHVYHDPDRLRHATGRSCARLYSDIIGMHWAERPGWVRVLLDSLDDATDYETERKARDALRLLREGFAAVREIALTTAGGARAHYARQLALATRGSALFDDLLKLDPGDRELDVDDASLSNRRQRLAYWWPGIRMYLRPGGPDPLEAAIRRQLSGPRAAPVPVGIEVKVTPTELAVVSILAGDWPDGVKIDWAQGATPHQIIESVKAGFTSKTGAIARAADVTARLEAWLPGPGRKK